MLLAILFSLYQDTGFGDYVFVGLSNGFVEFRYICKGFHAQFQILTTFHSIHFRFDLGAGASMIRSSEQLIMGNTYNIVAQRLVSYNRGVWKV